MPNITCSFDPNANPQFTFAPSTPIHMNAAGVIVMNRAPSSSWTFTGFTSNNPQLTAVVTPASVTMTDSYASTGRICYTVTVTQSGQSYTSPDPEIINDPPSPVPTKR
jgi:hypothetical protein